MTTCVISQPRLFPGLHYLHRMMVSDIFVILDTVQYTPRHEENRTKLKSPQGLCWLTVPVKKAGRNQSIYKTCIDNTQPWQRKAVKTLNHFYGKAPFYETYSSQILNCIESPVESLLKLNIATWETAIRLLEIDCQFVNASDLPVSSRGSQLLLDICKHLDADVYLSGAFGREYIQIKEFERKGIQVRIHGYNYPIYPQRYNGFLTYLSYIDMLFNVGLKREKVMAWGEILPLC